MQTMEHWFHNCKDYYIINFEDFKSIPRKNPVFVVVRAGMPPRNRPPAATTDKTADPAAGRIVPVRESPLRRTIFRQATVRDGSGV